jgi:MFS family permease
MGGFLLHPLVFTQLSLNMIALSQVHLIGLLTGIGAFIFGYDVGVLSGILIQPAFRDLMGFSSDNSANLEGNIATALQFGAFPGILIQSMINDRYGRKVSIFLSSIVFIVGCVLQCFTGGLWSMLLGRGVSGIGVGILMISANIYNSEISPKSNRGSIVGMQQFMVGAGVASAYWMNYSMAKIFAEESGYNLAKK